MNSKLHIEYHELVRTVPPIVHFSTPSTCNRRANILNLFKETDLILLDLEKVMSKLQIKVETLTPASYQTVIKP